MRGYTAPRCQRCQRVDDVTVLATPDFKILHLNLSTELSESRVAPKRFKKGSEIIITWLRMMAPLNENV